MKTFNLKAKNYWIEVINRVQEVEVLVKAIKTMLLPLWLQHLLVKVVLTTGTHTQAKTFLLSVLKAIPTNTNIENVYHQLAIMRLEPMIIKSNGWNVNYALRQVISYHKSPSEGCRKMVRDIAKIAVTRELANSVAWSAAKSAVETVSKSAADSSVYAISSSAMESAAFSARLVASTGLVSLLTTLSTRLSLPLLMSKNSLLSVPLAMLSAVLSLWPDRQVKSARQKVWQKESSNLIQLLESA